MVTSSAPEPAKPVVGAVAGVVKTVVPGAGPAGAPGLPGPEMLPNPPFVDGVVPDPQDVAAAAPVPPPAPAPEAAVPGPASDVVGAAKHTVLGLVPATPGGVPSS